MGDEFVTIESLGGESGRKVRRGSRRGGGI